MASGTPRLPPSRLSLLPVLLGVAVVLLCAAAAAAAAAADAPSGGKVLWQKNISGEAYWYGAVADDRVYAGTFAMHSCWLDVLDLNSGKQLLHTADVCRVDAFSSNYGAIGYRNGGVDVVYNTTTVFHSRINGGFYPALSNSAVVVRGQEMFVWGEEHFDDVSAPKLACMYRISSATGKTTRGPCLKDFGDGETAEVMSASSDGSVMLLSAGLKVIVVERRAEDWSSWTVRLNETAVGYVVSHGTLSDDGSMLAMSFQAAFCVYRYDNSVRKYRSLHTIPSLQDLNYGELAMNTEANLLAATFNDDQSSRQWGAGLYNLTTGAKLWTFLSQVSSGDYTDTTSSVSISHDGAYVAVGSWGDRELLNPQVHVFQGLGGTGTPLIAHMAPGSVTYVRVISLAGRSPRLGAASSELSSSAAAGVVVVALGLRQHENEGVGTGIAMTLGL